MRVRIAVLEQVDDHLDHQVLHVWSEMDESIGVALEVLGNLVISQEPMAVAGHDMEAIRVRPAKIDTVRLEARNEVVEAIQALRIHPRRIIRVADATLTLWVTEFVHAHRVDTVLGETGGGELGGGVVGRAGRIGKVYSPKLDRSA